MSLSSSTPSRRVSDGRISPLRIDDKNDKADKVNPQPQPPKRLTPKIPQTFAAADKPSGPKRKRLKSLSSDSQKSDPAFYNASDSDSGGDEDEDDDDDDDNTKSVKSNTESSNPTQDGKFKLLKSKSSDDDDDDDDDDDINDYDNFGDDERANTNSIDINDDPHNNNSSSRKASISNNIFRNYKRSYSVSNTSCFSQDSGDFSIGNDYYSNPDTFDSNSPMSCASADARSTSSTSSAATVSSNASSTAMTSSSGGDKHVGTCTRNLFHLKKVLRRLVHPSFVTVYGFCVIIVSIVLTIFTSFLLSDTMLSRARKQAISSYTELSWRHRNLVERRLIQIESSALAQAGFPELYARNTSYDTTKVVGFMTSFLDAFENGYSCSISRANGNFYAAYVQDGTLYTGVASDETGNMMCSYSNDGYKAPCADPAEFSVFEKPWYVAVGNSTSADDARWIGFFNEARPLYVFAAPAIDDDGRNVGVSTVSVLYELIGANIISYPESSGEDNSDIIFGIDLANGAFLGSYGLENEVPCVRDDDGTAEIRSLPVASVEDPDILDAAAALYERWGSSWNGTKVKDTTFVTKYGKTVSAAIVERSGLRWAVVMIGFRDYNNGVIDNAVGPGIIFVAFLISIVAVGLSINLMSPITTLSHDMAVVSKLKFNDVTDRRGFSWVKEIRTTQESFRRVAVGIEALSKYAPTAVLRDIMHSGAKVTPHLDKMSPVTIMFVDIVGLSGIIDSLTYKTQNAFSRVLTRWFREFCTIIQGTRGLIDKFVGGGIIALYGVPHRIRCPEFAAAYAAVEFRAAIKRVNKYGDRLSRKYGVDIPALSYRVGIHGGSVRAGHLGYSEHLNYTAIGTEIVVASKMEQLGKKFHVTPLVTGTIARRISREYLCVFLYLVPYPGCNGEYVRVCHLVGRKKEVPKKYFAIAGVFRKIHACVQEDDKQKALAIINAALGNEKFNIYLKALKCLYQSIIDGGISKNVYSNESSYYSSSTSNSYSQASSSKEENVL